MPSGGLTGARIRRRRLDRGVKQADLARACGISPSYLNLIEHDRRKIGGKLLADIAEALDVTPERLRIGADAQEIATLRAAAADTPEVAAELDAAEDFAARFPGWAGLVAEPDRRSPAHRGAYGRQDDPRPAARRFASQHPLDGHRDPGDERHPRRRRPGRARLATAVSPQSLRGQPPARRGDRGAA